MTHLAKRKTQLKFYTEDMVREAGRLREVVIEANPYTATVRLKGLKTPYEISWAAIWATAVKMEANRKRAEKKAAKR